MVEVGVGEKYMPDARHVFEREVSYAGAGVHQHIIVHQKGGGAAVAGDGARASEHSDFHSSIPCVWLGMWVIWCRSGWSHPM